MATNEILPFSQTDTGANLLTQAEYASDAQRPTGNQSGIARSKLINKVLKQTSLISAAVAKFMADNQANNVVDTATVDNLALWLYSSIRSSSPPLRNRIINGNFNVNQRGYVSGTATSGANQYTLDRWRVVTSGQNLTFAPSGNGNVVTAPAGGIEQVIEGANIEGGSYTISWTGTATCTINGAAATNGGSYVLTAGSNQTVKFAGGTLSKVQLEPGTSASPFEHRPIHLELEACQRYYEFGSFTMDVYCSGGSTSQSRVGFAVAKRVAPTIAQVATATGPFAGGTLASSDISTSGFSSGRSGWVSTNQASYTNTWTASAEF